MIGGRKERSVRAGASNGRFKLASNGLQKGTSEHRTATGDDGSTFRAF
jgi:hypothetical protein